MSPTSPYQLFGSKTINSFHIKRYLQEIKILFSELVLFLFKAGYSQSQINMRSLLSLAAGIKHAEKGGGMWALL
jgi:hypothetical protein